MNFCILIFCILKFLTIVFFTIYFIFFVLILEVVIMSRNPESEKHLSFEEQIDLFMERGMFVEDRKKAAKILKNIGYYKLKDFTYPFAKVHKHKNRKDSIEYFNISFNEVVFRYNQDKDFRLSLLHAIEDIEVSIKTQIAHTLSRKYGAMGYLNFASWSNRESNDKKKINSIEKQFKSTLHSAVKRVKKSEFEHYNILGDFPTVWVMVDIISFGDVIKLLDCMSTANLKEIASHYNCTKNELLTWMNLIKLVRNICAHNKNGIDLQIKTMPIIRNEWKKFLFMYRDNQASNRIAFIICIVMYLVNEINPDYSFDSIWKPLDKLINESDKRAMRYGFKNYEATIKLREYIKNLKR